MILFGQCLGCRRKFWWTGEKEEVPQCGGCGRRHNALDYKLGKAMKAADDEMERNRRRGRA